MKLKQLRRLAEKHGTILSEKGGTMRIEFRRSAEGIRFSEKLEDRCPEADGARSDTGSERVILTLDLDSLKRRAR